MHRHKWEMYGGCKENPGVFSEGSIMKYQERCECGAYKTTKEHLRHDGELVRIECPNGRVWQRDTRSWV